MKKCLSAMTLLLLLPWAIFAGGKPEAAPEAAPAAGGQIGGTVSVLAVWGGQELQVFNEMVKPFEQRTGIKVQYEGTRDINAVLTTRVQAGNPPDIAVLPGPGQMAQFAKEGKLVDLGKALDLSRIRSQYAQGWLDMGTVDGKLVGVFAKVAIKGLIWYDPKVLKSMGIDIPATWDRLMQISTNLADEGKTPWAIGLESGAASGWPGTDWLENIFLRLYGAQKYKEWYEGKLSWTSPEMKKTWQSWGQIVADPKMIYGGSQYVLSTNFGQAEAPLFTDPPEAYFHMQASFLEGFIAQQFPNLKPGEDYDFFGFPPIDPQYSKSLEAGGDLVGMFRDTPQARAFMNYILTPEAQSYWTSGSGALSANRDVSLVFYPSVLSKTAATILQNAEIVVFDASDMMPSQMNAQFWSAILEYVQDPSKLDGILQNLDNIRQQAY
jgi:alpha-glucoside transport system substrate-binding protein